MPEPTRPDISPDAFFAVDLRVGRIVDVAPMVGTRKPAWKLTVDFGAVGTLQTSAQVTNYAPEELIGRMVVGVVNIGERRIAGFRSRFLVLGAVDGDGTVRLLSPDAGARPGERIA